MSHVRKQIREAVATALGAVATTYVSRVWPVEQGNLPVLLVYSGAEQIEGEPYAMDRRYAVVVEAIAEGNDDALDDLLVGIETGLTGDLGGLVVHMQPVSVEITNSAEGSAPIGRARITYEALYRTSYADPQNTI